LNVKADGTHTAFTTEAEHLIKQLELNM